jgi:programmed cell death protein 5
MDDSELAAIRAAHLNQLKQQDVAGGSGASGDEAAAQHAAEEEMRRDLLATVLDTAARERRMSP